MEALSVEDIPHGPEWQYEPKWDGFRCLVFRDGENIDLRSKSGQPFARYFPDLVAAFARVPARSFVLDGEIVVPHGNTLSFDDLLQRIHPAASRVTKLAAQTPALFIAFDLLVDAERRALVDLPHAERRRRLEAFAERQFRAVEQLRLSPSADDLAKAERWLTAAGGALDGVVAKWRNAPYRSRDRSAMRKIKQIRSADCVVGGFRYGTDSKLVGSLLLGLYDEAHLLHHVGFTSGIKAQTREALTKRLERLIAPPGFTGKAPGGPSRWSTKRSSEWCPLKPKLVVEVCYDHFTGDRFRHGTRLLRWRPDKAPAQCTLDQVAPKRGNLLALLDGVPAGRRRRAALAS